MAEAVSRGAWMLCLAALLPACGGHGGSSSARYQGPLLKSGIINPFHELTSVGSTLFFTFDDGAHGLELWKTNGTPAGTVMVKDIAPGSVSSRPNGLVARGRRLYFVADDGVHGSELWTSDGTVRGTVLVKDINPGAESGFFYAYAVHVFGDAIFFPATDGTADHTGLWKSDGTEAGTVFVSTVVPGGGTVSYPFFADAGGQLFFCGGNTSAGPSQLCKTDGTTAGTVLLTSFSGVLSSLQGAGDVVYFSGYDAAHGTELWTSDGTVAGTHMVIDLKSGTGGSNPRYIIPAGAFVYFSASDGTGVEDLWQTDGTAAGTRKVEPSPAIAAPGFQFNSGTIAAAMGNKLYFSAVDNAAGFELWTTDGTVPGTVRVFDLNPGVGSSVPIVLAVAGSTLYLSADNGATGHELWVSDGTSEGTSLVLDAVPGPGSSWPNFAVPAGSGLYFTLQDGSDYVLWKILR